MMKKKQLPTMDNQQVQAAEKPHLQNKEGHIFIFGNF